MVIMSTLPVGIIHLVRTINFPKNQRFTPWHTQVLCVLRDKIFAYVLNEWSRNV